MPRLSAFRSRFFWKNYSAFAVLFLGTTLLVSGIVFIKIRTSLRATIQDNLKEKLELIVPEAQRLLSEGAENPSRLLAVLGKASRTRITLIKEGGEVAADSEFDASNMENHWTRPEVQLALTGDYGWAERRSGTAQQRVTYVAKAVANPTGQRVGVARISLSTDQIDHEMRDLLLTLAAVTAVGALLALGLGWTLAQRVSIPIWEMVQVAEAMRGGKYSERVRTITHDEVGRLGDTLNRLGSELTSKISELQRLETVRRDFVANVSHEIKTPLTSIKGYVETLLSGAVHDPVNSLRFLEKIERNAERLTNLVQDLLSLAKIEATEGTLKLQAIDWSEVVASVVARNEDAMQKKHLRIKTELPPSPVRVMGDREAVTQVVDNLLTNAIKYTPEGGKIVVSLASRGIWGKLTVSDNGIGIPAEHLHRIFERFYRVDKARSRDLGGTGLGLSIVKHLVSAMGGEVHVESMVGTGSTFSVRLRGDH